MRVAWIFLIAGCGFPTQLAPDEDPTAAFPDAAAFDYARCPASYSADLQGPSRYRLLPQGHSECDGKPIVQTALDAINASRL